VSATFPNRLVVVGGASLDTLHFAGRTARSAGGAGLYTALAARRAGARVLMVAPRPEPIPPELEEAAGLLEWHGPAVTADQLPTFEIAHKPGGCTEMLDAKAGAEATLGPENLPTDLAGELVFLIAMAEPRQQLALLEELGKRGCRVACGAYMCAVDKRPETVRQIFGEADIFFCNESEASGLFGGLDAARAAPGKLLFVTRGARGARVFQGETATDVEGIEVAELDPTGAGDTFSGTALALLQQGIHPVRAARRGVAAAAEMITRVGPQALLAPAPPPPVPTDPRARVDRQRIARIAPVLAALDELRAFPFIGPAFPAREHPQALDFFFAATLQQFGFWVSEENRYARPMIATLGGRALKGSDFLWAAFLRWLDQTPSELAPQGQARLSLEALTRHLRADGNRTLLAALETRVRLANSFGRDLLAMGTTPAAIVARANRSPRPVAALLAALDHLGGYKEDPLRKKSALLALILRQRPEGFLRRVDGDTIPPIVDYHVQRSCLRTGIVRVDDAQLRQRLEDRCLVDAAQEWAVRRASYDAMLELVAASGRKMEVIDWFFFRNRTRCPEMTEPDCTVCPLDGVCAKRKALFQPVHRTTFY
jgi:sugar/nucleoside kinase (ribokinase family)